MKQVSGLKGRIHYLPALMVLSLAACSPALAQKAVCDAHTYGAKADGQTKDTKAIQAAIDDCTGKGGGTVKLSGGVFVSGPIVLKNNVTLQIDKDSTLLGSPDHADYPLKTEFNTPGVQSLVSATSSHNISIIGGGVIDGAGQSWWEIARSFKGAGNMVGNEHPRPRLVVFDHCQHLLLENITIQNSPMWQVVPFYSDDITIRNVKVLAPSNSPNTDAIDPFSSTNIVIDHVYADVGDDNIAIKSGAPGSPGPDGPSKNIKITDCVFMHGHGLSIGSEIAGGVQNVTAERISFKGTDQGIRVKSARDRGNDIGNFHFKDIKMEDVKTAIMLTEYYPGIPQGEEPPQPVTRLTPHFHDITIENVTATGSKVAVLIKGLPESPIKNVVLKNINISAAKGMTVSQAEVNGENVVIRPQSGQPIAIGAGVTGKIK